MIEGQTEVLQASALLLLLAAAVAAIGVTMVAKVPCRRVHKFQVPTVVLVVVLVVVFLIP
jgi:phosphatidylserine synthase